MTDFTSFDFTSFDTIDPATGGWVDLSNGLADFSADQWSSSIGLSNTADQYWIDGNLDMWQVYQEMAINAEWNSQALYDASWDAWYGPVNSEGYTAYDASMGYTSTDTSFIEPASSAGSMSMISSYDTSTTL